MKAGKILVLIVVLALIAAFFAYDLDRLRHSTTSSRSRP